MPYGKTNSPKMSKLHIPYSRGFLWKKVFLQIFAVFSSLLHFKQKVLSLFVGKGRNGCQNSILRVQNINFLVEKLKYPQLFILLVLTAKNSLRKSFGRLVKSVLVCTTVKLWGKLVFWSFVFLLGFWIRKLCLMAKETQRSCQNFFFWVQNIIFLVRRKLKIHKSVFFAYFQLKSVCENFLAELSKMYL